MPEFKKPKKRKQKNQKKKNYPIKSGNNKSKNPPAAANTMRKVPKKNKTKPRQKPMQRKPLPNKKLSKKQKRRGSYVIYYALAIILIFIVVSILSVTLLFNTDEIIVVGESEYQDDEIILSSEMVMGVNLIRLNTGLAEEKIMDKLILLDSVNVKKNPPKGVIIEVEKAIPYANVKIDNNSDNFYIISKLGRVLYKTNEIAECVSVRGYEPKETELGGYISTYNEKKEPLIFEIIETISKTELEDIIEIDVTDHLNIIINYQSRVSVVLGSAASLEQKLRTAKEMFKNEIAENEFGTLTITNLQKITFLPLSPEIQVNDPQAEVIEGETVGEEENYQEFPTQPTE